MTKIKYPKCELCLMFPLDEWIDVHYGSCSLKFCKQCTNTIMNIKDIYNTNICYCKKLVPGEGFIRPFIQVDNKEFRYFHPNCFSEYIGTYWYEQLVSQAY